MHNENGGGDRIRTCGTLTDTPVFKTDAFNHSATPPKNENRQVLLYKKIILIYPNCHQFLYLLAQVRLILLH